jgi:taurine dioxygenase
MPAVDGVSEITVFENDRERPAAVNFWHSDLTSLKKPPMGAVLYAHIIPPTGGDTLWSNMYAAFDALSGSMKRFLTSLVAVHAVDPADYGKALGDKVKIVQTGVRSAEHPVVRTHPVTGRKSLFVNAGSTKSIKDMKASESDALLQMLFRHVELPEFQVRFRWQQHSIAIWDNRCTQHYAVADYWPHRRVMYRAAIDGDAPY